MSEKQWIGIDVCQKYLDVYIRPSSKLFQVTNEVKLILCLLQKGKLKKVALTACMHKMLIVLNAIMKNNQVWRHEVSPLRQPKTVS